MTGSFAIRLLTLLKAGVYPASLGEEISAKAPNFYRWAQVVAKHPSVTSFYDEDVIINYNKGVVKKNRTS